MQAITIEHIEKKYSEHIKTYTDGSTDLGVVGIGIHGGEPEKNQKIRLNDHTSICTAELTALQQGLQNIWDSNTTNKKHVILTDSRSAMEALEHSKVRGYRFDLIASFRKLYTDLTRICKHSITICWIPSHVGVIGNEKADNLAKEALTNPDFPLEVKLGTSENKSLIMKRVKGLIWQKQWDACKISTLTKELIPKVNKGKIAYSGTGTLGKITRLRLNRPYFNTRNGDEAINCDQCNEPKTLKHVLLSCQNHEAEREIVKRKFDEAGEKLNIFNLLSPFAKKELRTHSNAYIKSINENI